MKVVNKQTNVLQLSGMKLSQLPPCMQPTKIQPFPTLPPSSPRIATLQKQHSITYTTTTVSNATTTTSTNNLTSNSSNHPFPIPRPPPVSTIMATNTNTTVNNYIYSNPICDMLSYCITELNLSKNNLFNNEEIFQVSNIYVMVYMYFIIHIRIYI